MIQMLKNKKGIDYSAMMVLVTLILVIYMYIQLASKVESFETPLGGSQVALLNAYQSGENALLYVDQSAKMSVYRALDEVAASGAVVEAKCGIIEEANKKIYAWSARGMLCLDSVQPYEALNAAFNKQMDVFTSKYQSAMLPAGNYVIFVQNNSVTGTAIKSARVLLQPPPELRKYERWFITITTAVLKKAAIGEYSFKPSFTVPVSARLEVYDSLKAAVRTFYECTDAYSVDDCLKTITAFSAVRSSSNPDYLVCTAKNPVINPYGSMSDIIFALYAPESWSAAT
ncbi:MAG: hypothetical protein QXR48_00415 [Candidatus Woesearchaeota archaeon]